MRSDHQLISSPKNEYDFAEKTFSKKKKTIFFKAEMEYTISLILV